MNYTNKSGIALPVAVWLATDDYDYVKDPNYISATSLLKPLKSMVLSRLVPGDTEIDIAGLINSRLGTAVHDSIEKVWKNPKKLKEALLKLGYPSKLVERVVINPKEVTGNMVPAYMEIRSIKEIDGFKVGGKFDFVIEGKLSDFKTTKTYSYIKQSNTEKYSQQGSIYRWLNPNIITEDIMNIEFLFTDWSPIKAVTDKSYPSCASLTQAHELMSIPETENFIRGKLNKIKFYANKAQSELPDCTPEELWQEETKYAYYKDKNKLAKAFRVKNTMAEANELLVKDGGRGIVIVRKGEVKYCKYCPAVTICDQAKGYVANGLLKP